MGNNKTCFISRYQIPASTFAPKLLQRMACMPVLQEQKPVIDAWPLRGFGLVAAVLLYPLYVYVTYFSQIRLFLSYRLFKHNWPSHEFMGQQWVQPNFSAEFCTAEGCLVKWASFDRLYHCQAHGGGCESPSGICINCLVCTENPGRLRLG